MSRQDAIGAAKRFVAVVGKKYPVDKAYVFGSFAKGRDDESSDIDVCIVSRFFGKNYLDEEMELRGLSVNGMGCRYRLGVYLTRPVPHPSSLS
ncbi:MAG: DNA polymerase, beta-like protein region [Microgenomates group bacterium Gr01-1014_16]|nr:MAG: DNA polymerase, beta-like protein region [Microgenomates group bacterium Gr01-1014_16]